MDVRKYMEKNNRMYYGDFIGRVPDVTKIFMNQLIFYYTYIAAGNNFSVQGDYSFVGNGRTLKLNSEKKNSKIDKNPNIGKNILMLTSIKLLCQHDSEFKAFLEKEKFIVAGKISFPEWLYDSAHRHNRRSSNIYTENFQKIAEYMAISGYTKEQLRCLSPRQLVHAILTSCQQDLTQPKKVFKGMSKISNYDIDTALMKLIEFLRKKYHIYRPL